MSKGLDFDFEFTLSAGLLRWGLVAGLCCAMPIRLASESVSMPTYYPAPSGVYTQMNDTQGTWLARDTSSLWIGTAGTSGANGIMSVMGGRVGLGTTAPADMLEVNATAGRGVIVSNGGSLTLAPSLASSLAIAPGSPSLTPAAGGQVDLNAGGATRLIVDGAGNVGIGTLAPRSKLDVVGAIQFRSACPGQNPILVGPNNSNCSGGSCCPAGQYITWQPGIVTDYQYGTRQSESGDGQAYCCNCPPGGCPF